MEKALQIFSDEQLEQYKELTALQIVHYLEDFRLMHSSINNKSKSKLISMKVPEDLLDLFKKRSKQENIPYQTKIKILMKEWLGISKFN